MNNPIIVFPSAKTAELQQRELTPLGSGEVLVKNHKSLISIGTEMTAFCGEYPPDSVWEQAFTFPFDTGYAAVGEVVELGKDVDKKWLGRRVGSMAPHCRYANVKEKDLRHIHRDEVSDEEAVFYIIAQIVMRGIRMSKVGWGNSAVIFGMGLLGHFATCFCRLSGAKPVFAVDTMDFRLDLLPEDSSLIKVNPLKNDLSEQVKIHTRNRMADIVFEVTGNAKLIPDEFKLLHDQGRFIMMSSPKEKTLFDFHDLCNFPSHTIIGAHNFSHPEVASPENPWTANRHCEQFFDLVADGELDVKRMITNRISYKVAPEMYNKLLKDRSHYMGIVIDWEDAK
ncbi:MAG: zinc-binding alcohol dehydrogenase [Verrucomicrobiota bacterium]|nr:zinc-binding alcohol dehydrogenase [Verrucomicrobiota bacterium]